MALIQTVHLSMANFKSAPVVPAVQNDTDRQVKMIIDDYTLTSGLIGKIAFERSDGTHYEASATLDTATNSFTADIDQALTQPGRTMVQLKVTDTLTVSSFSFVIFVEADNSGTVTPQEGIDLVTAVASAEAAADRAESAASSLELDATLTSATKAAQAKAVGDALGDLKSALFNSGDSAVIQYSSLPVFSAGFMNRDGTISSGSGHEVLSMPVGAAESISLSLLTALSGGLSLIVLKDSAGNVVSDCRTLTAQTEYQFDIPSGYSDGTLYFNWFNYSQETYVNQATVTYEETAKFADKTEVEKKADRLLFAGKKVYFFGDSIVAGYTSGTTTTPNSFPKIFADAVGAVLSNYGVASSSFCGGYPLNENVITIPAKIQATDLSDADYIFIAGGVNDCQIGATEGDFSAAISSLMTWLKSNVSVPVIFILPINFSRTFADQIHPLELYGQYLSVYAEANGYKVIHTDGYGFPEGTSATATELAQLLYGDGLHPTEFGHQVYGMALARDVNLAVDAK